MDTVDKHIRSKIMSSVGQRDMRSEIHLSRELYRRGYRYQVSVNSLAKTPDIVFPKYQAAIFVHGCFWHSHVCKYSTVPKRGKVFGKNNLQQIKKRYLKRSDFSE